MSGSKQQGSKPTLALPPEAWAPLLGFVRVAGRPLERFLKIEASSGILLLLAAATALLWVNSPWAESYNRLWDTPLGIEVAGFSFQRSLGWVVNDGLMVIFFFVVGMEIRREIHHGELSEWKRAALPMAAALGGMIAPALIYLAIVDPGPARSGWGVPMATDIAFAVGVLTLLGRRVPAALRVLLLALAVIDDLGAIIVIAIYYSSGVALSGLLLALAGVLGIFAMQALGIRHKLLYVVPGVVAWAGIYAAGIHPTIAGVIIGFVTPVRAWLGLEGLQKGLRQELEHISAAEVDPHALGEVLRKVNLARREAISPAESLIELLHPWVAFLIMPVFALANAGVALGGLSLEGPQLLTGLAAAVGLVVGKPVGVVLACTVALRLNVASLPAGITFRHQVVLGVTAGIGFTMSLFIAQLAFSDPALLGAAKLGVLAASGIAGVLGLTLGALLLRGGEARGAAKSADEAERRTEA